MTRFGVNYGLAETPSIEAKAGNLLHIIPMTSYYSSTAPIRATYASPHNSSSSARLAQVLARILGKNSPLSSTYCISCYLFHCDARTCCGCTTTPTITILWCGHTHKNDFVEYHYPQKQFCEGNQALQGLVTLRTADLLC